MSAAAVSRHTASCFQRSARTRRRPVTVRPHAEAVRASAPAPFAVSVRFQFVVIVFVSCGFPRLFRLLLLLRGSVPGGISPNRSRGSSIGFKSVKIMFGLNLRSGAAHTASVRRFPSASDLPARLPPSSGQVRMGVISAVHFSGLPPRSGLLFRSFAVRCVHGSYLSSVRFVVQFSSVQFSSVQFSSSCFVLFCPSCSTLLVSVRFSVSSIRFVLSSSYALCPLTGVLFILFSRILYTISREIQMYFLSESMLFLRIVQIIDVKAKKFDALEYSTRPSRKPAKTIKEQAIFYTPDRQATKKRLEKRSGFLSTTKKTCSVTMLRQASEETEEFGLFPTRTDANKFRPNKLVFLYCFQSLFSCFQRKRI